jgi:hypothetical protein
MDVYNVELFLHVTGVVIVFAGYGALLFATCRAAPRWQDGGG